MFWISSSPVSSPSTSGAANAEHHGSHSSGPNDVSATPSPDTSTARTCMPSPSEGHPTSPVFVATQAVPSTPGANTPATLVTLQTGNPSPMSSPVGGTSAGVGSDWTEGATPPSAGTWLGRREDSGKDHDADDAGGDHGDGDDPQGQSPCHPTAFAPSDQVLVDAARSAGSPAPSKARRSRSSRATVVRLLVLVDAERLRHRGHPCLQRVDLLALLGPLPRSEERLLHGVLGRRAAAARERDRRDQARLRRVQELPDRDLVDPHPLSNSRTRLDRHRLSRSLEVPSTLRGRLLSHGRTRAGNQEDRGAARRRRGVRS